MAANHLGPDKPFAQFTEKDGYSSTSSRPVVEEEDDADMDALIAELESNNDNDQPAEEEIAQQAGAAIEVPEELLQTSEQTGLTDHEVIQRRKRFGSNQMKDEKENLILKFLGFFVGPIQFVMEVSSSRRLLPQNTSR